MIFKVWDKVKCIDDYWVVNITKWSEYEVIDVSWSSIRITDNHGWNIYYNSNRFELLQEDKLPHELIWLPKYFVVKKDESDPLWGEFTRWMAMTNKYYIHHDDYSIIYYWYLEDFGFAGFYSLEKFSNNKTLITLEERDRIVNKRDINDVREKAIDDAYSQERQTKQLSKPIRSCEYNWSIYKEDTIDWVSIEEMKQTRDNINSKLLTHRDLFTKKK